MLKRERRNSNYYSEFQLYQRDKKRRCYQVRSSIDNDNLQNQSSHNFSTIPNHTDNAIISNISSNPFVNEIENFDNLHINKISEYDHSSLNICNISKSSDIEFDESNCETISFDSKTSMKMDSKFTNQNEVVEISEITGTRQRTNSMDSLSEDYLYLYNNESSHFQNTSTILNDNFESIQNNLNKVNIHTKNSNLYRKGNFDSTILESHDKNSIELHVDNQSVFDLSKEVEIKYSPKSNIFQNESVESVNITQMNLEETCSSFNKKDIKEKSKTAMHRLRLRKQKNISYSPQPPVILGIGGPMNESFIEILNLIHSENRTNEKYFSPSPSYMQDIQQGNLNVEMRSILIDWMCEVSQEFQFNIHTFHLAVNYLDRFLSKVKICEEKLQLCGIIALMIASKYNERLPPCINDYVYITDFAYKRDDFLLIESLMLNNLNFRLSTATMLDFIHYNILTFMKLNNYNSKEDNLRNSFSDRFGTSTSQQSNSIIFETNQKHENEIKDYQINRVIILSIYLSELSLLSYDMLSFSYSMKAISALTIAMEIIGISNISFEDIIVSSGFDLNELKKCIEKIHEIHIKYFNEKKFNAIKSKYSAPGNYNITSLAPLDSLSKIHFNCFNIHSSNQNSKLQLTPNKSTIKKVYYSTPEKLNRE